MRMGESVGEDRQDALLTESRRLFHVGLLETLVRTHGDGTPNFADKDSRVSSEIARGILDRMFPLAGVLGMRGAEGLSHQTKGVTFEDLVLEFLDRSFPRSERSSNRRAGRS